MDQKKSRRLLLILLGVLITLAVMIYVIGNVQFRQQEVVTETVSPSMTTGELVDSQCIRQKLKIPADEFLSMELMTGCYLRENQGTLILTLTDENGSLLCETRVPLNQLAEGEETHIPLSKPIKGKKGKTAFLSITSEGCHEGNAITLYIGAGITAGRLDLVQYIAPEDCYTLNGEAQPGMICVRFRGLNELSFYRYYWIIIGGLLLLLSVLGLIGYRRGLAGERNAVSTFCIICDKYCFLVKQLVIRDFKTKYKRSVLGVAWSFLNPLLSMAVQYIIFSTLFRSNIENYPVYLLTGIVFFNFFNEVCSLGLTSITDNASLIKKVYLSKYVYPLSRVISSLINFSFSLIPLLGIMFITQTAFRASLLLLIFDVLCLTMFNFGMVLILSTMMTFFQDTRFIWSVLSMIWMYMTPLFYPENIIPARFATLYHMNPMYQFITFARTCIIGGVSPAPTSYLWCLLSGTVVMVIGILIFRKHQDQFVLNL